MSNFEKAVEVLREAYREPSMSPVHACDIMANALEAAGLLAPDLPNKDFNDCGEMSWIRVKNGLVEVIINSGYDSDYKVLTPDEAREYALTILAAADYAEKEQDNESRK